MGGFVVFILFLFALAAVLRIDFFFTILYLLVGVYILAQVWTRRTFRQLSIQRQMPERAFSGDKVKVTLKVVNQSRLPIPWLMFTETLPIELRGGIFREVVTLTGRDSYYTDYELTARKRGYYRIGPLNLQSGDIFGIHKETAGQIEPNHLIVYPRIVPITQLGFPAHSPQVILPTTVPLFRDPSRIIGVRDYVVGDNPRHIHWSASASSGQTMVKQFQPAIARDNVIFLNLDRDDYANNSYPDAALELAIVVAASLANHITGYEKLPTGLITTGLDPLTDSKKSFALPTHKGQGHLMQILEVLARVQSSSDLDFLGQIQREVVHLAWGTTLIIITGQLDDALQRALLLLKQSGFQVTLIVVHTPRYKNVQTDHAVPTGDLPIFEIRREKDIEVWVPTL